MVFVWEVDWISLVYVPWDLGNLIFSNFLLFQMIFCIFTIVEFSVKLKPMSVCLYLVKMEGHALIMRGLSLAYVFLNSLELFVMKLLINVSINACQFCQLGCFWKCILDTAFCLLQFLKQNVCHEKPSWWHWKIFIWIHNWKLVVIYEIGLGQWNHIHGKSMLENNFWLFPKSGFI